MIPGCIHLRMISLVRKDQFISLVEIGRGIVDQEGEKKMQKKNRKPQSILTRGFSFAEILIFRDGKSIHRKERR